MQRLVAFLFAFALLAGTAFAPVAAQNDDATPEGDEAGASGLPTVGDPISVLAENGEELALITVEEITDPFEDFGEFFTPEDDVRYVAVELTIENTDPDDDAFEVQSYSFQITDASGFVYTNAYVVRDEDAEPADLENADIEPGEETNGLVVFAVPEDADLGILYYNTSDRILPLADLAAA
jgi:hypothetical protein